jgi:CO dehydrogenase nickel-insertion accessory protein CooC1
VQSVDLLVLVTDPSQQGLNTVRRLYGLAKEMGIQHRRLALVVNRLRQDELPTHVSEVAAAIGVSTLLGLPDDTELAINAEQGLSLWSLSEDNRVLRTIIGAFNQLGLSEP